MREFFSNWTNIIMLITLLMTFGITFYTVIIRTRRKEKERIERFIYRKGQMKYIDEPFDQFINKPIEHFYPAEIQKMLYEKSFSKYKRLGELEEVKPEDEYEKKKDKYINIANISFHYADKERIKSFYDDYFKEPTIKNLIRESVSETGTQLKGGLPSLIESQLGEKDLSKWISKIKLPDITINGMFKRYQKETLLNNQVRLGTEDDDIELSTLRDFENKTEGIAKDFGFQFDITAIEIHKAKLKEKAAERTLQNLEKASGWVLIDGNFQITKENEKFYKVKMKHPVSNYLEGGKEVLVSCLIPIKEIEPSVSGNYSNSLNKSIPLKIYGQVWQPINRGQNIWELIITPLAVY